MSDRQSDAGAPPDSDRRLRDCVWGETERDRRNNKRFLVACILWMLVYVGIDLIQEKTAISDEAAWALALLPAIPAVWVYMVYMKFLRETDEMVRRVQLNGLAVGFAAGAFMVIGIQAPGLAGDRIFDQEMVLVAMTFGWVAGQFWGAWRYR